MALPQVLQVDVGSSSSGHDCARKTSSISIKTRNLVECSCASSTIWLTSSRNVSARLCTPRIRTAPSMLSRICVATSSTERVDGTSGVRNDPELVAVRRRRAPKEVVANCCSVMLVSSMTSCNSNSCSMFDICVLMSVMCVSSMVEKASASVAKAGFLSPSSAMSSPSIIPIRVATVVRARCR